jgi:phosphatidylinositol 3-kinase
LADFLIQRGVDNLKLGNFLYWYLVVECAEPGKVKMYSKSYEITLNLFKDVLSKRPGGQERLFAFELQGRLYAELTDMWTRLRALTSYKFSRKEELLRQWLEPYRQFRYPMPLPLNPEITITGILPEKARIFTSAKNPFRLVFTTNVEEKTVAVLFKAGDDLRQDQLIIQLILLMDTLLKQVQLDLKLTPYAVLAMSSSGGMVEFVEYSETLASVLKRFTKNQIQNFLLEHHPDKNGPYGIEEEALKNFVKSIAGYCVITYILGVGDRHNDNLLIRHQGNLFHIDFGYILGEEPLQRSILPPPFKLSHQMVEAMGGSSSNEYYLFKVLCSSSFLHLRKNSNLIVNLLSLMVDADIPGIASLGGERSILKVQEKFFQDMTQDQASACFQDLIQASQSNVMGAFWDWTHDKKQNLK